MQQLCALREQYARLQDDYKCKLVETSKLRTDVECLKRETREAKEERERLEIRLVDAQERLRIVEEERDCLLGTWCQRLKKIFFQFNVLRKIKTLLNYIEYICFIKSKGCKEQLVEQEQALLVAKQRYRETQEELEELRTMIRDQASQLDDYRNKYLIVRTIKK